MPHSFTTHPVVGQPGVGGLNWGTLLINWINSAEAAMNENLDSINNHDHDSDYAGLIHSHYAEQIETQVDGQNLDEALFDIMGQSSVPINLATIKSWYDVMNPDTSGISANASVSNMYWGVKIVCSPSSPIFVRSWEVIVKKGTSIIYQNSSSGSVFYVHETFGFESGDELTIQVKYYTGTNTVVSSDYYSHTYNPLVNPDIAALQTQLANLSLANIIDSLVQDDAAMTAFANRLQSSNLLANKIASILGT